jgi:hypothetical protein
MGWHYWGIGHGKGPHDRVGTCLNQVISLLQMRPSSLWVSLNFE